MPPQLLELNLRLLCYPQITPSLRFFECGFSLAVPEFLSPVGDSETMSGMTTDFTGKRALVTGAGDGIGRALALRLADLGAKVFAMSLVQAELDSLKAQRPSIEIVCVDLTDWEAARAAVKQVTPINLLVNNAGATRLASVLEVPEKDYDFLFNINVKAVLNVSQVVAADLVSRKMTGNIVSLSSQAAHRALTDHIIYSGTKAAVEAFTRAMALELGPKGIRANAVCPTAVMTAMGRMVWSDPAKGGPMLARIPQGKFAEVEDVVNAVVYLLSDKSDMINGHMLPVDGGMLCA
ncbi:NAD(P)-binding domain [Trinorchestia longiramus]|nr:NAD(P)-binding domain [Trinorchestia longiramus]